MFLKKYSNEVIYILAAGIIILAKLWHIRCDNHQIIFILNPLKSLVSLMLNIPFQYDSETGYFNTDFQLAIDKSCAGFNFMIIAFSAYFFSFAKYHQGFLQKFRFLFIALFISYILALLANTARILSAVKAIRFEEIIPWLATPSFHESLGLLVYLTFLILTFILIHKIHQSNSENYENRTSA